MRIPTLILAALAASSCATDDPVARPPEPGSLTKYQAAPVAEAPRCPFVIRPSKPDVVTRVACRTQTDGSVHVELDVTDIAAVEISTERGFSQDVKVRLNAWRLEHVAFSSDKTRHLCVPELRQCPARQGTASRASRVIGTRRVDDKRDVPVYEISVTVELPQTSLEGARSLRVQWIDAYRT